MCLDEEVDLFFDGCILMEIPNGNLTKSFVKKPLEDRSTGFDVSR